jgi:cell division septum initiation protein DivIVA
VFSLRRPRKSAVGGAADDELQTAARVLALAQQTADRAIADAQQEADRIIAAARREADEIRAQARAEVGDSPPGPLSPPGPPQW